jgi:Arc/MetJ-type ribon-helix-helix transcriptional regulator
MNSGDKWRVQITLDEESLKYLRSLVESGECTSISQATRKIITKHREEHEKSNTAH